VGEFANPGGLDAAAPHSSLVQSDFGPDSGGDGVGAVVPAVGRTAGTVEPTSFPDADAESSLASAEWNVAEGGVDWNDWLVVLLGRYGFA